MRILIVGGYGTFGGRLARLLANEPALTLLIAGRSLTKAQAFCGSLPVGAKRLAQCFDRDADVTAQIREIRPDLVVDATGPFQVYGANPYRIVLGCLENGIDYIDLADGSDFVKGIAQFDAEAKRRGIYVLSGASTCPLLTAAVTRHLSKDLARLKTVVAGIAPSPYAGVGLNVIRAIASYSGRRLQIVRDGKASVAYAMTETRRYTIGPPGQIPLQNFRFSLVDVPDLQLLPELWPELEEVWVGAGPGPEVLQRILNALAWLVRLRALPSLRPLAGMMHRVTNLVRWGEHRGGMFVEITGASESGVEVRRSWHLLAEGDDGPYIPSMACASLIRKVLAGTRPMAGARPAIGDLELEDYQALFQQRKIVTGIRHSRPPGDPEPLYQRVLGDAWEELPREIREMHQCTGSLRATGKAEVKRGTGLVSRVVGASVGFPAAGLDVPLTVEFRPTDEGEHWIRSFAGRTFSSLQWEGSGRSCRLLREGFGPLVFDLALVVEKERLYLVVRGWSLLGLPLPLAMGPRGLFHESVSDGRFHFHVEITHPLAGLIVGYRGWLVPIHGREERSFPTRFARPGLERWWKERS